MAKIYPIETTHIDRRHFIALRIDPEPERLAAAALAELMVDHVFVEMIGGDGAVRRLQRQLVAWDEPQQRALAAAVRAVAIDHRANVVLALGLEGNVAAVTASLIKYVVSFRIDLMVA